MVKTCKIIIPIILLIAICPSVFAYTTTQNTYTLDCTGDFNTITFYANSFNQIGADSLSTTDDGDLVTADISVPISIYKSGLSPSTGYLNGYYKFSCNITITGSESTWSLPEEVILPSDLSVRGCRLIWKQVPRMRAAASRP